MAAWTKLEELGRPVTITFGHRGADFSKGEPDKWTKQLQSAVQYMNSGGLEAEHFTYTRMVYKLNNQWRHKKAMQYLKRFEHSLRRIKKFGLQRDITEIMKCIEKKDVLSNQIQLPSKQMIEYVLVKLMAFSQLCAYLIKQSIITFDCLRQELSSGDFMGYNLMFAAIISRVWLLLKALLVEVCSWYSQSLPWRKKLRSNAVEWLPTDEHLPDDLMEWLGPENNPQQKINRRSHGLSIDKEDKSPSYLDKLFAAADDLGVSSKSNGTGSGAQTAGNSVGAGCGSLMDIGEPISAQELKTARKRKEASSGFSLPSTKKARHDNEKPRRKGGGPKVKAAEFKKILRMSRRCQTTEELRGIVESDIRGICQKMALTEGLQKERDLLTRTLKSQEAVMTPKHEVKNTRTKAIKFVKKLKKYLFSSVYESEGAEDRDGKKSERSTERTGDVKVEKKDRAISELTEKKTDRKSNAPDKMTAEKEEKGKPKDAEAKDTKRKPPNADVIEKLERKVDLAGDMETLFSATMEIITTGSNSHLVHCHSGEFLEAGNKTLHVLENAKKQKKPVSKLKKTVNKLLDMIGDGE